MKVVDPGHKYALSLLDYGENAITSITFVKRMGANYPGNTSSYPGTTLQETMRACLDRTRYLNHQKWSVFNLIVQYCLVIAVCALEYRAALRHRRWPPLHPVNGATCWKCLHVGCTGSCHPARSM